MTSEGVVLKDLASPGNAGIPYADEDGTRAAVSPPPRLGRSRIFAKEELMYAANHNPQKTNDQPHNQFAGNQNPSHRAPLTKASRNANPSPRSSTQDRPDNFPRRSKIHSRRAPSKDVIADDDNPLKRYENALLRYRKPNVGSPGGPRTDRREVKKCPNNGYSSSDSECAVPRYKSKSTSSLDTQSVNNILDEYEDLDYGRSSDLSDSGSISVTNFEAVMDQRKRQQQQQQQSNLTERSNRTGTDEEVVRDCDGQLRHHDQPPRLPVDRAEPVFKVNQQTQVRQRSRDRQASARETPTSKLNPSGEEQSRSRNDSSSATAIDSRSPVKQPPEVFLRKGAVQKRVDEWLNQTQSQNFAAPSGKRETARIVSLVRSSSSAEPKNSRRCRNDARSRSTDENSCERLNGTASYDDINRSEITRNERKIDRTKNPTGANSCRGTYRDYLAVRNRSRIATDYGFVQGSPRSTETASAGSRIPQRGHSVANSRRRQDGVADDRVVVSGTSTVPSSTSSPVRQDKNSSRGGRTTAGGFARMRPDQSSINGPTPIFANGRAASFKRARSDERNAGLAAGRVTGVPVKEDQQSSAARTRGGQQQQQFSSKGQPASGPEPARQRASATSPNKVGESRRPLGAGRQSRVHEDSIERACKSSELSQQTIVTNEIEEDSLGRLNEQFNKLVGHQNPSCAEEGENEKKEAKEEVTSRRTENSEESCNQIGQLSPRSPEESRKPRPRLIRENSDGVEHHPRRPPAPPRRDQSRRSEQTSANDQRPPDPPCSSFRPTKRMYTALRQLNEQNSFTGPAVDSQVNAVDSAKSHYAAPNKMEKIYDRLQPRVIHSDDLESILKPVVRASAYGEATVNDTTPRLLKNSSTVVDVTRAETDQEVDRDNIDTTDDDRTIDSPRNQRYQDIGLDQCIKVQRRHPSARVATKDQLADRDPSIVDTKSSWNGDDCIVNEPVKTFGTFQPGNATNRPERIDTVMSTEDEDSDDAVVVDVNDERTCRGVKLQPIVNLLANIYEARPWTLGLDRSLGVSDSDNEEVDEVSPDDKSPIFTANASLTVSEHPVQSNCAGNSALGKVPGVDDKKSFSRDKSGDERGAVVNEVLVKNLRFQQDVVRHESPYRSAGPMIGSKPFNFNSVLSDDYERIQAGDCGLCDDTKIYVTKEEMERQKMMDLLRRGDYEAVKSVSATMYRNT